jgi:hypothetical protein
MVYVDDVPVLTKICKRELKFLSDDMYQYAPNKSFHFSMGTAHGIYGKNLYNTVLYPDQEVRYSGRVIERHFMPFCKTSLQDQDLPVI